MRAGEKGEKSHSDYKGIPIPVVKKRGQTWQWKQTYNEAFVPKLLGSHTRNRGTWVGGDWLGQGKSERLMFVKRKQNWLVCFKKGWEDKSKKKAACYCRIHPLTSENAQRPRQGFTTSTCRHWVWSRKHSNAQRQLLWCQRSSFEIAQGYGQSRFLSTSLLLLSQSPSWALQTIGRHLHTAIFSSSQPTNMFYFLTVTQLPGETEHSRADQ